MLLLIMSYFIVRVGLSEVTDQNGIKLLIVNRFVGHGPVFKTSFLNSFGPVFKTIALYAVLILPSAEGKYRGCALI